MTFDEIDIVSFLEARTVAWKVKPRFGAIRRSYAKKFPA